MKRAFALCLTLLTFAEPARAESSSERADRLFREGKAALEAKQYAEACAKLAESQAIDPGTGTLLALGLCHEASHKLAAASRELTEVLSASQSRADRATLAKQHLKAIEPKLSTLTIKIDDSRVEIQRDGKPAIAGEIAPVDGGEHVVEASGPGMKPYREVVTIRDEGDRRVVTIPPLERAATTAAVAPPPESPSAAAPQTVGWIIGGAGVVVLGVGAVFGAKALGDRSDAKDLCPSSPCSSKDGVAKNDSAMTEAWVANGGIVLGVAAIAVGAYLLVRSPTPASNVSFGVGGLRAAF